MELHRRSLLGLFGAALLGRAAGAHHGYMQWDFENPIVLEGWVSKEMDGFPHWEFWMRVDSQDWEVDVGDQFTLKKAGLSESGNEFAMRRTLRVDGARPVDRSIFRILPTRIIFDDDEAYDIEVKG
ncbi:MAG: hypothetical protein WD969_15120 [Paracoccaceae bacterium]